MSTVGTAGFRWAALLLAGLLAAACSSSSGGNDAGPEDAADGAAGADGDAGQADGDAGQADGNDDQAGDASGDPGQQHRPYLGILQFDVRHNLQDDSCLARDDCHLSLENEDDIAGWLGQIAAVTDLAVLHWDRSIPWLVFAAEVPAGGDRVAFYDSRLDDGLRAWIDAFAAHFAALPHRYLALTPLNGVRDSISPARIDGSDDIAVAASCPVLAPGTQVQFSYDTGNGQQQASFDLQRAFTNFTLYLYDKLHPEYLALLIEANIFKNNCPEQWTGLVELYRAVHDAVRAEVGAGVKLFATLTFKDLLAYEVDRCVPLQFEDCTGSPSPPNYPQPNPLACFPLDLSALADLDQGDRLDLLALSFYPDALVMAVGEENLLRVYAEDWDGSSPCLMRAPYIPFSDPFAALERFGWHKPVAMAEIGARSCPALAYLQDGNNTMILQPSADLSSQAFWLEHGLSTAEQHHFEFYVQSFLRDYQPLGLWTVRQDILDPFIFSVFNTFSCMGLYDDQGQPKSPVTDTWEAHRH